MKALRQSLPSWLSGNITRMAVLWGVLLLAFVVPLAPARPFFGSCFLALTIFYLTQRLSRRRSGNLALLLAITLVIAYYSILGSVFFYLYRLSYGVLIGLTAASPLLLLGSRTHESVTLWPKNRFPLLRIVHSLLQKPLALGYLFLCAFIAFLLLTGITFQSTVSPWLSIHAGIFPVFFILVVVMIALIFGRTQARWTLYIPLFLIALGIAAFVFPLGFGFDPFIHEATEKLVVATGTVTPRPAYYVGFYALVVWLSAFLALPLDALNRFIVPVLSSVMLPLAIYSWARYAVREKKLALIAPLVLLLFPYPELIQSTPQSLSFLWSVITILAGHLYLSTSLVPSWLLLALALGGLTFHPLTGIPVALFVAYLLAVRRWHRPIALSGLLVVATVSTVGLGLLLAGARNPAFHAALVMPSADTLRVFSPTWYRFIKPDDLIYLFAQSAPLFMLLFALVGLADMHRRRHLIPLLSGFTALIGSYVLIGNFLQFDFATAFENAIFAERILRLSIYFLLPAIFFGLYHIAKRVRRRGPLLHLGFVLLLASAATISFYLSYPRFDTREQSKGYTASSDDYAVVHWIERDARDDSYVVLANQTVAGVAVKELGFKRYYHGLFYYPLPTNGPLYQQYLTLTRLESDADAALAAVSRLTGVSRIYLAVNDYWDSAEALRVRYLPLARDYERVGTVSVFRFEVP
ncbi:MAG: hypothetical protein HY460_02245 [Parcubacteria group bacterium]|nr:hypothetical protein [Parcubacteria group bacterium]